MLTGIFPPMKKIQGNLFIQRRHSNNQHKLMQKVDNINSKYEAGINHFTARPRTILANKTTILISK